MSTWAKADIIILGLHLGEHAGLGFFEEGDHLITSDSREALKEIVDRFASLQVLDQCLDWHASSYKDRRPAKYVG